MKGGGKERNGQKQVQRVDVRWGIGETEKRGRKGRMGRWKTGGTGSRMENRLNWKIDDGGVM